MNSKSKHEERQARKKMVYVKPQLSVMKVELESSIAVGSVANLKPGNSAGDVEVVDWLEKEHVVEHIF